MHFAFLKICQFKKKFQIAYHALRPNILLIIFHLFKNLKTIYIIVGHPDSQGLQKGSEQPLPYKIILRKIAPLPALRGQREPGEVGSDKSYRPETRTGCPLMFHFIPVTLSMVT